jgi:hypothetical protein
MADLNWVCRISSQRDCCQADGEEATDGQMRWSRHTVQGFLEVRIHVLNGTLENAFRQWHIGFRPIAEPLPVTLAA